MNGYMVQGDYLSSVDLPRIQSLRLNQLLLKWKKCTISQYNTMFFVVVIIPLFAN